MTIYDFSVDSITGDRHRLDTYRGQVLLIVNTASFCGYAPQFEGLERLYRTHKDNGFAVIGFPSNQFGRQEPGTNAEIDAFARQHYAVTFPLMAKLQVNGPNEAPLFTYLKKAKGGFFGRSIKWNFTKFLIGRDGTVLGRYGPRTTPDAIEPDIIAALAESAPANEAAAQAAGEPQ